MAIGDLLKKALGGMRDTSRYGTPGATPPINPETGTVDPYAQAMADYQAANRRSRVPQILDMIGAGMRREDVGAVADRYAERTESGLQNAIDQLNAARDRKRQDTADQRDATRFERESEVFERETAEYEAEQELQAERRDPNSETSRRAREAVLALGLPEDLIAGRSAADLENFKDGPLGQLVAQRAAEAEDQRRLELEREKARLKAEADAAEAAREADKPSAGQEAFQKQQAKDAAENYAATQEMAAEVPGKLETIDSMLGLLDSGLNTGPLVSKVPGSQALRPQAQQFEQLSAQLQLDAADQLSGVLSDSDMKLLRQSVANLEADEDVNRENLQKARRLLVKAQEEAARQRAYVEQNGSLEGYTPGYAETSTEAAVVETRRLPDGRMIEKLADGTYREVQ